MYRVLPFLLLAACGSPPARPQASPTNTVRPGASSTPTASAAPAAVLVAREIVDRESGVPQRVWILPGRESHVDPNDPCCGLSYDGNRYDDELASCAPPAGNGVDCGPGKTGVYPGLAEDAVCGARRRCVPLPEVRVVVQDGTSVSGVDAEDQALTIGDAKARHQAVHVGREGFVVVTIAGRAERIAVDYGSRYTIEVRADQIARITRD